MVVGAGQREYCISQNPPANCARPASCSLAATMSELGAGSKLAFAVGRGTFGYKVSERERARVCGLEACECVDL